MDIINGPNVLKLVAGAHANAAEHTPVVIKVEKRVGIINGQLLFPGLEPIQPFFVDTDMIRRPLQCTLGVLGTGKTVRIVVGYDQFYVYLPDFLDFRSFGSNNHSVLNRRFT